MGVTHASPTEISAALAPLSADPGRAAIFFDLDGTLAPIVDRPEDAAVPGRTRELVERIAGRYLSAGVVTGRRASEARRILGLDQLIYVGNHGFELMMAGHSEPEPAPALAGEADRAPRFVAALASDRLRSAGLRVEDKAAIQALHWRGADDEDAAERLAAEIGAEAEAEGLHTHRGRKVVELRPAVELDKGVGLRSVLRLLPAQSAFYAGDDRTDVDAFQALAEMASAGRLERAVRVAVISDETPAEVADAADLAVDGPEGFVAVLEGLA